MNSNIICDFFETSKSVPNHPAIVSGREQVTYDELWQQSARLAAKLAPQLNSRRVGILGSRSIAAYVAIVGIAASGATYAPLNMKWPEERLIALMQQLELDALVVDRFGAKLLTPAVLAAAPPLVILADDADEVAGTIRFHDLPATGLTAPAERNAEDLGYIVYTSGSTGMPKGVMVPCGSLKRYLDESEKWGRLSQEDRVAEAHDITFDLSVHNMFMAWRRGATLYLMSQLDMMAPQNFVRRNQITVWMSVPTIVNTVRRAGKLTAGLLPSLRLSIFCGEPLSMPTVEAWADAAPNSEVENIYGPTECTIVCTRQRLTNPPVVTEKRGILAIGAAYENFEIAICNEAGQPIADGLVGEIALASPQLSAGYFKAPEQTAKAFRNVDGKRWYYTGDLGMRDGNGVLHHMGRSDNQVKMKGNRIELEEVEMHLRRACQTELATVVAWPIVDGSPQGLVAFQTNSELDEAAVKAAMKVSLPEYMIPARVITVKELPRNINDKVDRRALFAMLEHERDTVDQPMVAAE